LIVVSLINASFFCHFVKITGSVAGPKRPYYDAGGEVKSKWIYHVVPPVRLIVVVEIILKFLASVNKKYRLVLSAKL